MIAGMEMTLESHRMRSVAVVEPLGAPEARA